MHNHELAHKCNAWLTDSTYMHSSSQIEIIKYLISKLCLVNSFIIRVWIWFGFQFVKYFRIWIEFNFPIFKWGEFVFENYNNQYLTIKKLEIIYSIIFIYVKNWSQICSSSTLLLKKFEFICLSNEQTIFELKRDQTNLLVANIFKFDSIIK